MSLAIRVEYAADRKIRARNKPYYRLAHWPIWIWVFFLAPGPLTFELFAHGGSTKNVMWLGVVLAGTGMAGRLGQLPGVEARPYILRFSEDKPNPLYRRICYTFAWNALISFALLNLIGLLAACALGRWELRQIYDRWYLLVFGSILLLGAVGILPRVRVSTKGEGIERRYFYGTVWAVTAAQTSLMLLWKVLPRTHLTDLVKTSVFIGVLGGFGFLASLGILPRTRPILPGELMIAD